MQELLDLGVKRILNLAIECDDDHGLRLRERFERYVRIPMRDTVEEDNITRGVREACTILGTSLHPPIFAFRVILIIATLFSKFSLISPRHVCVYPGLKFSFPLSFSFSHFVHLMNR